MLNFTRTKHGSSYGRQLSNSVWPPGCTLQPIQSHSVSFILSIVLKVLDCYQNCHRKPSRHKPRIMQMIYHVSLWPSMLLDLVCLQHGMFAQQLQCPLVWENYLFVRPIVSNLLGGRETRAKLLLLSNSVWPPGCTLQPIQSHSVSFILSIVLKVLDCYQNCHRKPSRHKPRIMQMIYHVSLWPSMLLDLVCLQHGMFAQQLQCPLVWENYLFVRPIVSNLLGGRETRAKLLLSCFQFPHHL